MSKEGKRGGFFSFMLIVVFAAAAIFFCILYFSQKVNFDESRKILSEAKSGYGALLSDISNLRLQINASEDENKKMKEAVAAATAGSENIGKISGVLSHEKNPLPLGLIACAEAKSGDGLFCASQQGGGAYELKVPAGEYYVFAMETCYPPINNGRLSACPSNVAYYTEFVKCNPVEVDNQCPHSKALLTVSGGAELENINPSDWFRENK
jgi:hypothetical protein